MVFTTAELYKNTGVDVIKDNRIDGVFFGRGAKMKHVQNGLGLKIIRDRLRRSVQEQIRTNKNK